MSTIYDSPCPPPTDDEEHAFAELLVPFMQAMVRRFGRERAEVILDDWHASSVATDITARFERDKARRILADLNEHLRFEQYVDHMEWDGEEARFRPWLLVPTREP